MNSTKIYEKVSKKSKSMKTVQKTLAETPKVIKINMTSHWRVKTHFQTQITSLEQFGMILFYIEPFSCYI